MSSKIHQKFPSLIHSIFYIIPVEDGDPYEASVMQGFSRSLMSHSWIIQFINTLPSDIIELTPEGHKHRVVRRMSGATPIHWHGQSPKALGMMTTPEFTPFTVLCLGQTHKIDTYREWIDSHTFPLTVIAKEGGTLSYENFSIDALKNQFLTVCDAIEEKVEPKAIQEARSAISSWSEIKTKKLGYQVGGHNSIYPNCAALDIAGLSDVIYGPFEKIQQGIDPYVEQIRKTSESIFDLRDAVGERSANEFLRPPPDLNFFAPSLYPFFKGIPISTSPLSAKEKKRFTLTRNALERQTGYMFEASTEAQAKALFGEDYENGNPEPNFIFMERAAELRLASNAVGSLAASEISCVARLPNSVNRTKGRVRLFAENYRSRKTNARKRSQSFKSVQKAITQSVPEDLINLIDRSKYGIRLISDAHLEWMEYNGLPLCLQKDVSRIPTTPGNLFLSQLGAKPALHLSMEDFSEVLIINALKTDDPISPFFDIALDAFSNELKGKIQITKKKVGSRDELIDALNEFKGALVIFDGHGSHDNNRAAVLHLQDEAIDIWSLEGHLNRPPPIVLLSACDTHAADRNHASTANGFLSLGTRAVISSVFPLLATDAASFAARLIYRVAEFIPHAQEMHGRSLTWMEVVSGLQRMVFLTDFLRHLERKNMIDESLYKSVHYLGNMSINSLEPAPYEPVIQRLVDEGLDESVLRREMAFVAPNSSSTSYLHVGRPETILIHAK